MKCRTSMPPSSVCGTTVRGNGNKPRTGAHGLPVIFLHPNDFCGTLIELEEIA